MIPTVIFIEFVQAVRSLDFERIKNLIEQYHINVNAPWGSSHDYTLKSQTILHVLALVLPLYVDDDKQQKIIDLLIFLKSKGLNVNAQSDYYQETALHILAKRSEKKEEKGHSVVQIFVQQGAAMDALDYQSKTPFSYLFDRFLSFLRDYSNDTVIQYNRMAFQLGYCNDNLENKNELLNKAILFGRLDLAYYLLSIDHVDPSFQQEVNKGILPLMLAESPESFDLLFQFNVNVNLQGECFFQWYYSEEIFSGITCAHFFIIECQDRKEKKQDPQEGAVIAKLKILLDHGADFNISDAAGKTVLRYAVEFSLLNVVAWLVHQGVKLNVVDGAWRLLLDLQFEPCHIPAIMTAELRAARSLLGYSDSVLDEVVQFHAIKVAVIENNIPALTYLLTRNVNLNFQGSSGREPTLLMYAHSAAALKALLMAGADPSLLADYEGSIYPYNISKPVQGMLTIHVTHRLFMMADFGGQLGQAVPEVLQQLEVLRQFNVNFNVQDSMGRTSFYYAVSQWLFNAAQWLVDQGVDVRVVAPNDRGVLAHLAASCLSKDILAFTVNLIERGVRGSQEDYDEIIRMLMQGGDFETVNKLSRYDIRPSQRGLENHFGIADKGIFLKLIELGLKVGEISLASRHRFFIMMIGRLNTEFVLLLIQHGIGLKEIEVAKGSLFVELFRYPCSDYTTVMAMVGLLVTHGADLNVEDKITHKHILDCFYDSIYGYAVNAADLAVDILLEKGADVRCCQETTQEKMVVDAVRYKHLNRIINILSKITDPARKSILLQQMFLAAIYHDDEEMAGYCLDQCDENLQSIVDINALINPEHVKFQKIYFEGQANSLTLALFFKSSRVAALLVSRGADVCCIIERHARYAPWNQGTPFHVMVYQGLSTILESAVSVNPALNINNVKMNGDNGREVSLLQLACRSYGDDHEKTVNVLLNHGSDIYDAVLHDVCSRGYVSAVRSVLSRHVDVNQKNNHGHTALDGLFDHYSYTPKEKITEIAVILLEAQAEVTVETINKAIERGCSVDLLKALLAHVPLPETLHDSHPLLKAMLCHRKELFDFLLEHCRDSCAKIRCCEGPLLHQALMMDDLYYADQLMAAGADLNDVDRDGYNVLHVLAIANQWDRFSQVTTTYPHLVCQANNEGEQPWNMALFSEKMDFLKGCEIPVVDQALYRDIFQYLVGVYKEVKFAEDLRPESFLSDEPVVIPDSELHDLKRFSYRLMSLFGTVTEVQAYFSRNSHQSHSHRFFQRLHDMCLFNLPMQGSFSKAHWGSLAVTWGENVTKYLHAAVRIEKLLGRPPMTLEEIHQVVPFVSYHREAENPELARLFKRYNVTERGFDVALGHVGYLKESDHLPDITIEGETIGLSKRYYFKKLPPGDLRGFYLGALTSCCQSIGNYHGHGCALHGMTSEEGGFYVLFERPSDPEYTKTLLVTLEKCKTEVEPVEMFLSSISNPDIQKKYREKLEEFEPGFKFRYGRYATDLEVLEFLKNELNIDLEDKVAAQCWGWRNKDGHLVLDSWESKHKKVDKICECILKRAAEEMLKTDPTIVSVSLGGGGHTPSTLSFPQGEVLYSPDDYNGYRDSVHWQYLVDTQEALQHRLAVQQTSVATQASASSLSNPQAFFSKPPSPEFGAEYFQEVLTP